MAKEFEDIYKEYFRVVYLYSLSLAKSEDLAEEITQETFFKALNHLDQFQGNCKISTWLCQIAKNTYFSLCKKEKRLNRHVSAVDAPDIHSNHLEDSLLQQDSALEIHKVLHSLKEPYKEVFELHLFAELSYAQIAQLFGKTESWARVTYYRAKIKIQEGLQ